MENPRQPASLVATGGEGEVEDFAGLVLAEIELSEPKDLNWENDDFSYPITVDEMRTGSSDDDHNHLPPLLSTPPGPYLAVLVEYLWSAAEDSTRDRRHQPEANHQITLVDEKGIHAHIYTTERDPP